MVEVRKSGIADAMARKRWIRGVAENMRRAQEDKLPPAWEEMKAFGSPWAWLQWKRKKIAAARQAPKDPDQEASVLPAGRAARRRAASTS